MASAPAANGSGSGAGAGAGSGRTVLVTGGSGYLGQILVQQLERDGRHRIGYTYMARPLPPGTFKTARGFKVDLSTGEGLDGAFQALGAVDCVVNCAALSQPALCEQDYAYARSVNVPDKVVAALARQKRTRHVDALLVHVSTDQARRPPPPPFPRRGYFAARRASLLLPPSRLADNPSPPLTSAMPHTQTNALAPHNAQHAHPTTQKNTNRSTTARTPAGPRPTARRRSTPTAAPSSRRSSTCARTGSAASSCARASSTARGRRRRSSGRCSCSLSRRRCARGGRPSFSPTSSGAGPGRVLCVWARVLDGEAD